MAPIFKKLLESKLNKKNINHKIIKKIEKKIKTWVLTWEGLLFSQLFLQRDLKCDNISQLDEKTASFLPAGEKNGGGVNNGFINRLRAKHFNIILELF